ncbi:MAG: RNA polymerase sigma-70 factor [Tannerellaceae bacterium]|jgi:RNA polymerase sigma-70 factor (ECF subfamily)|nr:RNA polymerase sigma-70 factor [Tannerellaceae bacterium]
MKYHSFDTDEELFQCIRKGDERAFDALFMRYYAVLCAYSKQFVDIKDGQEIVQDMMVWIWENRRMQVIESSLRSYLFKSVKNRCLTLISRNERNQRMMRDMPESLRPDYEDPDFYVVEELSRKIEDALQRLPDSYREAFELNRFHNMTYHEIAQRLNVSPKTVDYRIQQALKLLRVELKDYLPLLSLLLAL